MGDILIYQTILKQYDVDESTFSNVTKIIYLYLKDNMCNQLILILDYNFITPNGYVPNYIQVIPLTNRQLDSDDIFKYIIKLKNNISSRLLENQRLTELIDVNNLDTRNILVRDAGLFKVSFPFSSNNYDRKDEVQYYINILRSLPNTYIDIIYIQQNGSNCSVMNNYHSTTRYIYLQKQITLDPDTDDDYYKNMAALESYGYTKYGGTYIRPKDLLIVE